MTFKKPILMLFISTLLSIPFFIGCSAKKPSLVIYTSRKEHLIKPLIETYTKKTGVQITYITGKAGSLIERLKAEGMNSPADIFITVDAGNLYLATKQGILTPVRSKALDENIPSHLKEPNNHWYGFSVRARTIVYNTTKVNPNDLRTYADLGSSNWKGRLLLRTSKKVYNQSLVAMMIKEYGENKTESIIKSWVSNLAAPVFSSDTKVLEAIAAGQGDVGIINTYYFGRLLKKKPNLPLALFWANQATSGTHVNISGAGVLKHSKHKQTATDFLSWLSTEEAQHLFADLNLEYPANPKVNPSETVAAWGKFSQNMINVTHAGEMQSQAIKLMDRAKYK